MTKKNNKAAAPPKPAAAPPPVAPEPAAPPKTLQELGRAILAQCDPVKAGGELLRAESESVKIRALETFADWSFGAQTKPPTTPAAEKPAVRIIWNLPAPPHEKEQP